MSSRLQISREFVTVALAHDIVWATMSLHWEKEKETRQQREEEEEEEGGRGD